MDSEKTVPHLTTPKQSTHALENAKTPPVPTPRCEVDDIASEPENASDNEELLSYNATVRDEVEEVVGFSIGQRQNYMKSAQTPAAEKSQAIENNADSYSDIEPLDGSGNEEQEKNADNYFDIEPLDGSGNKEQEQNVGEEIDKKSPSPTNVSHQELPRPAPQNLRTSEGLPSPWRPGPALQQRSAATRAFLAGGFTNLKRRASSGSSALTDNVRKFLSELPSLPLPKNSNFANFNFTNMLRDESSTPRVARSKRSSMVLPEDQLVQTSHQKLNERRSVPHSSEGNISSNSSIHGQKPRSLLRRSTSDNSLYLRRGLSHTTTLDDTSRWDDVSGQVNSRFKAITDSFQDSRVRLPKVPSINFTSFKPTAADRIGSETAKEKAVLGVSQTGVARSSEPSLPSEGGLSMKAVHAKPNVVSGEHRAHPIMAKALEGLTGDVVVLGGYRGSILRSAKPPHRQLWVPVKIGLNLRKVNLEVGLTSEDEEKMEETIFSSGVLSHIGPVDICRRLLRHLRKCPNARSNHLRVHDYGYDWRLSPHLLSRKFLEFVEKLRCNQPDTPAQNRGVTVIAHSLGGLITRHAVNLRPELFAGIVYAGVPQRCVNILGPLRNGDSVLLSSRVLTAQVNFSMRTSFALLPEDGKCFINKQTGERYDIDFFDVRTWEEYRLSPCINPPLPPLLSDHRKSLIGALSESLPSLPVPSKRSSWSFGREASPDRVRDILSKNGVSETAETAAKAASEIAYPEEGPPALEPSMGQPYNRGSIATACTISRNEAIAYLSRTLGQVRAFKEELAFKPEHEANNVYPPLTYMFAKSTPTVYGARVASREAIKYTDAYDDLAFAAGDGVVLASAAMLPRGYRCVRNGKVETDRGHVGLLGDIEGVGKALQAVIEARAKGVGLGKDHVHVNDGTSVPMPK